MSRFILIAGTILILVSIPLLCAQQKDLTDEKQGGVQLHRTLISSLAEYPDEIIEAIFIVTQDPRAFEDRSDEHAQWLRARALLEQHPAILQVLSDNRQSTRLIGQAAARDVQGAWRIIDEQRAQWASAEAAAHTVEENPRATREQIMTTPESASEQQQAREEQAANQEETLLVESADATVTSKPIEEGSEVASEIAEIHQAQEEEKREVEGTTGIEQPNEPQLANSTQEPLPLQEDKLHMKRQGEASKSVWQKPMAAMSPEDVNDAVTKGAARQLQACAHAEPLLAQLAASELGAQGPSVH